MGVSIVSSSENDRRHICASVISGEPSTIVKPQLPREGNSSPSTTDFGMTVTAAPVSTLASIVNFLPVDGFSRLIHTYTCSYGASNFNRSMVPVFISTFYNLWLRKTDGPPVGEIDVPKVWDNLLFLFHDCICIWLNILSFLFLWYPAGSRTLQGLLRGLLNLDDLILILSRSTKSS